MRRLHRLGQSAGSFYNGGILAVARPFAHWSRVSGSTPAWADEAGGYDATLAGGWQTSDPIVCRGAAAVDLDGGLGSAATVVNSDSTFAWIHQTWVFSISLWLQWHDSGGGLAACPIGSAVSTASKGFAIYLDDRAVITGDNSLRCSLYRGQAGVSTELRHDAAAPDSSTHHVVVTADGTTARLYLDGAEVDSAACVATSTGDASSDIQIGDSSGGAFNFDGRLSEITIWDSAITAADVDFLYQRGSGLC